MTNELKERFIADQVRALATIILTRRGDLSIVETKRDTGVDLHVYIHRDEKPMRLTFGVLLGGVVSPLTAEQANEILGPTMGQFRGLRSSPTLCVFSFSLCARSKLIFPGSRSLS